MVFIPGGTFLLDEDWRTTTIGWVCEVCGQPIEDGKGYLEVSYNERRRAKTENRLAHWQTLHLVCDREAHAASRWWAIERVRTLGQLQDWAEHVAHKVWIEETDWIALQARAAELAR